MRKISLPWMLWELIFQKLSIAIKTKAQGDEDNYQKLLEKAAEVNNTTPEQMGKLFDEIISSDIL
jgi:hypothetical protein